jgi:hypothetical protein
MRPRRPGHGFARRGSTRVTTSAVALVMAVTARTDGQAPIRLASGCEPPIAAAYRALSPAAATGPDVRYQSRAHQAPAAANSAPPRLRRPVRRATRNPPLSPIAAIAEEGSPGVCVTRLTLPTRTGRARGNPALPQAPSARLSRAGLARSVQEDAEADITEGEPQTAEGEPQTATKCGRERRGPELFCAGCGTPLPEDGHVPVDRHDDQAALSPSAAGTVAGEVTAGETSSAATGAVAEDPTPYALPTIMPPTDAGPAFTVVRSAVPPGSTSSWHRSQTASCPPRCRRQQGAACLSARRR